MLLRMILQKWIPASLDCPSVVGASWRGALNHQYGYLRIFLQGLHILYPSLPRLEDSVTALTTLLVTLAHSIQLLSFVYFVVAAKLHLLEGSTSYHILSHKAISQYVTKVSH